MMTTYQLAVFGHPIAHSLSPNIHKYFAEQAGISLSYEKVDPGPTGFVTCMRAFCDSGGQGFNVTMPFKQQAYACMDQLLPRAKVARAVNTAKVMPNGKLLGDNTDGDGFIAALALDLAYSLTGKNVLILGAGGAVHGILPAILAQKPAHTLLMNRTVAKAAQLAKQMAPLGVVTPLSCEQLPTEPVDMLIHAAAFDADTWPKALVFAPMALAYDLRYGAAAKDFMPLALHHGVASTSDGLSMLVCQAALAFTLWTGFEPDSAKVLSQLRHDLRI